MGDKEEQKRLAGNTLRVQTELDRFAPSRHERERGLEFAKYRHAEKISAALPEICRGCDMAKIDHTVFADQARQCQTLHTTASCGFRVCVKELRPEPEVTWMASTPSGRDPFEHSFNRYKRDDRADAETFAREYQTTFHDPTADSMFADVVKQQMDAKHAEMEKEAIRRANKDRPRTTDVDSW